MTAIDNSVLKNVTNMIFNVMGMVLILNIMLSLLTQTSIAAMQSVKMTLSSNEQSSRLVPRLWISTLPENPEAFSRKRERGKA